LGWAAYVKCTEQGNDFELMLMVKMKTRHPWRVSLEVNFRQSVIIAEYDGLKSHKTWKFSAEFFFGKTTPCGKMF